MILVKNGVWKVFWKELSLGILIHGEFWPKGMPFNSVVMFIIFLRLFTKIYSRKHVIGMRGEAALAMHSRINLQNKNLEG